MPSGQDPDKYGCVFLAQTPIVLAGSRLTLQLSDGQCICKSGFEYYNEGGVLVSNVDGAIDCQPIVYERCYTGEALDADGICVSERWGSRNTNWACYTQNQSSVQLYTATPPNHHSVDVGVLSYHYPTIQSRARVRVWCHAYG